MTTTPHGQVPEALLLADQYAAAHAKWALEALYGSSKSYTAEKLAERHAARAKLERALHTQQPASPTPPAEHPATTEAALGAALAASPQAPAEPQAPADAQLCKFYGVSQDAELIAAQARHIEKLQAKLPPTPSFAPQRVREG